MSILTILKGIFTMYIYIYTYHIKNLYYKQKGYLGLLSELPFAQLCLLVYRPIEFLFITMQYTYSLAYYS